MTNWRDAILNDFVPKVSKLTLVADPDCLLTEETLAMELRRRGFDLIEFNDPVEFRYAYESGYRSIWDRGEHTDLVVILRLHDKELKSLPYDLLQAGRELSFNLGDIFPNLSYPIIEKLDRSLLDPLYDAQQKSSPDCMGDNATKDFILRHVFRIAAELITEDVDLLRVLLRLHYGRIRLPSILAARLVQVLESHGSFDTWPLSEIISDDAAFFVFLRERWSRFLSKQGITNHTQDDAKEQQFVYSGPDCLPFVHQDIKVYIDDLFVEGKLAPIEIESVEVEIEPWIRSGIVLAGMEDEGLRISRLFDLVEKELPATESRHSDWIVFASKWAELSSLVHCCNDKELHSRLKAMGISLNTIFATWLSGHYSSLISLPPTDNPAMLHHVPRFLARNIEESANGRVALIVVDGLSLDQWVTLRPLLKKQDESLLMHESATFAWIPTLTSVSRQSIFSGKLPKYFPSSINSTGNEEKHWKQFWEGYGLSRSDVVYHRTLGLEDPSEMFDSLIHPVKTKVVGLVVNTVDELMHGMILGSAGMHNQIKQWCQGGFLGTLIGDLLNNGYDVWLTADHGNIQCVGNGRPSEGVIAEIHGERVRVYPAQELHDKLAEELSFTIKWKNNGLPDNYFPLIAGEYHAFVSKGESIVAHGGISIEEVIVPLVKFERKRIHG